MHNISYFCCHMIYPSSSGQRKYDLLRSACEDNLCHPTNCVCFMRYSPSSSGQRNLGFFRSPSEDNLCQPSECVVHISTSPLSLNVCRVTNLQLFDAFSDASDFYFHALDAPAVMASLDQMAKSFPTHVFTTGPVTDMRFDFVKDCVDITTAVCSSFQNENQHAYGGIDHLAEKMPNIKKVLSPLEGSRREVVSACIRTDDDDVDDGAKTVLTMVSEENIVDDFEGDFPGMYIDFGKQESSSSETAANRQMKFRLTLSDLEPRLMSAITAMWADHVGPQLVQHACRVRSIRAVDCARVMVVLTTHLHCRRGCCRDHRTRSNGSRK
jgi:hypothetical protein